MAELCGAPVEGGRTCIRLAHEGPTHAWRASTGFVTMAPVPDSAEEMVAVVEEVRRLVADAERSRLSAERRARLESGERASQIEAYHERLKAEGVA